MMVRLGAFVAGDVDDGSDGIGVRGVFILGKGAGDGGFGFIEAADGQENGGAKGLVAGVALVRGHQIEGAKGDRDVVFARPFEGDLEVDGMGAGLGAGGEVGKNIRDVDGPGDGVARPDHDLRDRLFPLPDEGGVIGTEAQLSRFVAGEHDAFEHQDVGVRLVDPDQELGALGGGVDEGGLDAQRLRAVAEEVDGAPDHVEQGAALLFAPADDQRGALIEAKGAVVDEGECGAAIGADADGGAGAKHVFQTGGAPGLGLVPADLDVALNGGDARHLRFADGGGLCTDKLRPSKKHQQRRKNCRKANHPANVA